MYIEINGKILKMVNSEKPNRINSSIGFFENKQYVEVTKEEKEKYLKLSKVKYFMN